MKKPACPVRIAKIAWRAAIGASCILLSCMTACNLPGGSTPGMNVTQAYQTVSARLTLALSDQASPTLTSKAPSETMQPTKAQAATSPPAPELLPATHTPTKTLVCNRAAAGNPIDITIPDGTNMQPGESFTKIWRLKNVGSCPWTDSYGLRFFFGAQMSAPELVVIKGLVSPDAEIEIAVDMIAPATPGVHQGNWKLQNADGQLFGIGPNGDAPFWVRIVVQEPPTVTPTQTNTPTLFPTATSSPPPSPTTSATPVIQAGGEITLKPADLLDLDLGTANPALGSDLRYQNEANGLHLLQPEGAALLGTFGNTEPGLKQCQAAAKSEAPLALESLTTGSYLCFLTDQNLVGWLRYNSLDNSDGSVALSFRTWAQTP